MSDILKEIAEKERQSAEAIALKNLLIKYPDLSIHRNRWETKRYYSKSVNNITEQAEISHSCGCCEESPLYARPFLTIDGIRVYSDPVEICIGRKCYNGGETPDIDWRETLIKHNIPEKVINAVQNYLNDNPPIPSEFDD